MAFLTALPNLRAIAQDFLGQPYTVDECWRLVLDLLHAGGFGDYRDKPGEAIQQVVEIWFWNDSRDPLTLVQPWDWVLTPKVGQPEKGAPTGHIGLVVDDLAFVHVRRKVGVVIEPLQRWRARFIQLARWKALL